MFVYVASVYDAVCCAHKSTLLGPMQICVSVLIIRFNYCYWNNLVYDLRGARHFIAKFLYDFFLRPLNWTGNDNLLAPANYITVALGKFF